MNNSSPNMTFKVFFIGTFIGVVIWLLVFLASMLVYIKISHDRVENKVNMVHTQLQDLELIK